MIKSNLHANLSYYFHKSGTVYHCYYAYYYVHNHLFAGTQSYFQDLPPS